MMTTAPLALSTDTFTRSGLNRLPTRSSPANPVLPREQSQGTRREARPPRWRRFTGLMALVLVAVVGTRQSWNLLPGIPDHQAIDSAQSLRTVAIARPSPAATADVLLPATFRPWQTATLYARASGYLAAWHRDLGSAVKAGELLAEIDTPELDQELREAQALAREATAAVVQARAEREEAQAELAVAEAQLTRIQAEAELARSQLARREKLLAGRNVSQEEFETSQRQLEARTADVAAAKSDLARRRANLGTRAAVIAAREATTHSRQANVERLGELVGFKRIVAPFDGVVSRRAAEVGMLVTAGKEPLFVIEDTTRVRVQMYVPQTYSMQAAPGTAAVIRLPESSAEPVPATITRVSDSVDPSSRTMLAEIELDNRVHHFQPGSFAQVSLATAAGASSWTIPTNTLSMRVAGPHVAIVNSHSEIELKPVSLGRDLGKQVVVTDGIRGDERLVVNPGDDLADGMNVHIEDHDSARELAGQPAK